MCKFLDTFYCDGRYQACSCGKHLWSTIARRVLVYKPNGRQFLQSNHGKIEWDPASLHSDDDNESEPREERRETEEEEEEDEEVVTMAKPRSCVKRTAVLMQLLVLAFAYGFIHWSNLLDNGHLSLWTYDDLAKIVKSATFLERMIDFGQKLVGHTLPKRDVL
jgi:hypothetical protein